MATNHSTTKPPVVNSYTEWDLLEEVIVGHVGNAHLPLWDPIFRAIHDPEKQPIAYKLQGKPFPEDVVEGATEEVENFVSVLEQEGVKVRRPDPFDFGSSYRTPFFESPTGYHAANPRDVLLVVGQEILEVPTPRRHRHYEVFPYRTLLHEYARKGAHWTSAPRPMLSDETFVSDFQPTKPDEPLNYPLTEFEPVFDAADFMRCGRDIFYQRSFVTNQFGVDWLQQHLGDTYRFHEIESGCRTPIHIDTTFVPLAPGKALCNPKFVKKLPPILDKWDILWAPEPVPRTDFEPPFRFDSLWLSMNVFSIDEERVFVDSLQEGLIAKLKDWGFTPIPVPFQRYYPFGGGLHCSTLDVRRQGDLKSYF